MEGEHCLKQLSKHCRKNQNTMKQKHIQTLPDNFLDKNFHSGSYSRLLNFLTDNNAISKNQIGFFPNDRATDHIFTLGTLIDHQIKQKKGNYSPAL